MRYKFRGICISNGLFKGEWVYGDLSQKKNGDCYIGSLDEGIRRRVDPETVGQYTGLKDKNGKEIYEGDIVKWADDGLPHWIAWSDMNAGFAVVSSSEGYTLYEFDMSDLHEAYIIGNIHDDSHLLGGDKQ